MDSLLTIKEAAQYLRLNRMTIYKMAQKGTIPASKIGGNWRFDKNILDKWVAEQVQMNRGSVLIVDDDPQVRILLKEIIAGQGPIQVIDVGNGKEAIEQVDKHHFDLIFLDLKLPVMDGVEVMRAIKAKDENAVVAIITGYSSEPIAMEAMSLGPLLLIRKPFEVSDIIKVLNMVIKTAGGMR
jgi:two-component system response regulator (stage 0 sporulation protein F)